MTSWLRPLAWASLISNAGLILTGGAVRLTGSGLGCPTWPRCTEDSYVPRGALDVHEAIEFGNRMLTFVLTAIAIATLVAGWRTGRRDIRIMVGLLAAGIPAQALIGGITVLTDLNPWVVSLHLLCSLALVGVAVRLLLSVDGPLPEPREDHTTRLAWGTFAAAWAVLYVGTVVTGSGPHAGDADSVRTGLNPDAVSQLHADLVFLFIGLTLGLFMLLRVVGGREHARRAVSVLLGIEVAQGVVGYVQYATGLPIGLVEVHLLGAAAVSAVATWTLLRVRRPLPVSAAGDPSGIPSRSTSTQS
ncbi:heme A synthase [Nocardioides sp.]|uniref:COX15/CtaA family protein n=1 Tax=Nocardioides sp. TaxID=35761 RepID=UPI0035698497